MVGIWRNEFSSFIARKFIPPNAYHSILPLPYKARIVKYGEINIREYYYLHTKAQTNVGVQESIIPFVPLDYDYIFYDYDIKTRQYVKVEAILGAIAFEILCITIDPVTGEVIRLSLPYL